MPDMLVKLYELPEQEPAIAICRERGVEIRRAMAPDKALVVAWVKERFGGSAASECDVCFAHTPISCFVATRGAEIVGYACYDATAPNFFGPTHVLDTERGTGVGKALLLRSLQAMKDGGYAYAIIGGVGPAAFYEKCVNAVLIPDSKPGIYKDFIGAMQAKACTIAKE